MLRTLLEWILERPMVVVVVLVFIGQIVRGLLNARKAGEEHETQHGRGDPDEEQRVREVQERIRRQIAARRGQPAPPAEPPPVMREMEPRPIARPETTQMPDLLGGPLGRMLEELQKRAQPAPPAPRPIVVESRVDAELERQRQLADQLRSLEEARVLTQRRAVNLAADTQATAQKDPALRAAARDRLLGDLGNPQSLRRAFVLREVLGPPVCVR